jgi:MULE transposase-like protein
MRHTEPIATICLSFTFLELLLWELPFLSLFAFRVPKTTLQYCAAVAAFKELVLGDAKVEVFLTNDDTSLKTALPQHFPEVPQLLCVWHVNKNVQTGVKAVESKQRLGGRKQREEGVHGQMGGGKLRTTLTCTSFHMAPPLIMYIPRLFGLSRKQNLKSSIDSYSDQPKLMDYLHDNKYPKR